MNVSRPIRLRDHLRTATHESHAALDAAADTDSLSDPKPYARFLRQQYCARLPVEIWAERHCASALRPPALASLIASDLQVLGARVPEDVSPFSLPEDADPIGLAWAIAGSHLGNRMMLRQLENSGTHLPTRFLGDETMAAFWQDLLPELNSEATAEKALLAVRAAEAVFAHFHAAFAKPDDVRIAA